MRDELVDRADLAALPSRGFGVAEEQIRRERHAVAQLAAEDVVDRHAPLLAEDVEAGELQRGEHLRAVVVERRGRVGDQEAHLLELRRVVADEVRLERLERRVRALPAAAHLAQADEPFVGLDLDDGADEASPVAAVGVPQRRLERHGDGRGPDVGDLHGDTSEHKLTLSLAKCDLKRRLSRIGWRYPNVVLVESDTVRPSHGTTVSRRRFVIPSTQPPDH